MAETSKIRKCAMADAERDYAERSRSDAQWLQYCASVRHADSDTAYPAEFALTRSGSLQALFDAWSTHGESPREVPRMLREYNDFYIAAIEVLIRHAHEGRTT